MSDPASDDGFSNPDSDSSFSITPIPSDHSSEHDNNDVYIPDAQPLDSDSSQADLDLATEAIDDLTAQPHPSTLHGPANPSSQNPASSPRARYPGDDRKWLDLTRRDRLIASSLDTLQARDLSLHLLIAHRLKARFRHPEAVRAAGRAGNKNRWLGFNAGPDDGENPAATAAAAAATALGDHNFTPPDSWTSWPLEPRCLHAPGAPHAAAGSLGREALEEELLACTLRAARGMWDARQPARPVWRQARSRQGESAKEVESEYYSDSSTGPANVPEITRPVFTADDEQAWAVSRASIASAMSKLDDLLMGLHRNRAGQQAVNLKDSSVPLARSGSRARLRSVSAFWRKRTSGEYRRDGESEPTGHEPRRRGGDDAANDDNDDNDDDHGVNDVNDHITQNYNDSDDSEYKDSDEADTRSRGRGRGRKRARSGSPARAQTRSHSRPGNGGHGQSKKIGTRDWSEVLGIAAMIGWDPVALQRTYARCSALFDEKMQFRHMPEEQSGFLAPEQIKRTKAGSKQPQTPSASSQIYTCPEEGCKKTWPSSRGYRWREHLQRVHQYSRAEITEHEDSLEIAWQKSWRNPKGWIAPDSLLCPLAHCDRSMGEPFFEPRRLVDHIRRVHGYDPRTESPPPIDRRSARAESPPPVERISARTRSQSQMRPESRPSNLDSPTSNDVTPEKAEPIQAVPDETAPSTMAEDDGSEEPIVEDDDFLVGGVHNDGFLELIPSRKERGRDYTRRRTGRPHDVVRLEPT